MEENKEVADTTTTRKRALTEKQKLALEEGRKLKQQKNEEKKQKDMHALQLLEQLQAMNEENQKLKNEIIQTKIAKVEEENKKLQSIIPKSETAPIEKVVVVDKPTVTAPLPPKPTLKFSFA